jgi:hypothetical protein
MLAGKAVGSLYYPRGVTAILWLCQSDRPQSDQPLRDLSRLLTESAFDFA